MGCDDYPVDIAYYEHIVTIPQKSLFWRKTERDIKHYAVRYDVHEDTLYVKGIRGVVIAQYPPGQWLRIRTTPDYIRRRETIPPMGESYPFMVFYYKHRIWVPEQDGKRVIEHYAVRYDIHEGSLYLKGVGGAVIAHYPPEQWLKIESGGGYFVLKAFVP